MAENYDVAADNTVNIVHNLFLDASPGNSHAVHTCNANASMVNVEDEDLHNNAADQGQEASSSTLHVADYLALCHSETTAVGEDCICKNVQGINSGGQVKNYDEFLEKRKSPGLHISKESEVCAICHDRIKMEETSQIKGCEHQYCVTCILHWATYNTEPWCPQCRLPFSFLYVYKSLDGTLADYMFEESVCLLLRASWFKPLIIQEPDERDDYQDDYDVFEECYYTSNIRLGNRRWGDTGFVRGGRREARPVGVRQVVDTNNAGSSRQSKGKELVKETVGRRARRTQKRQQIDKKMAAEN